MLLIILFKAASG